MRAITNYVAALVTITMIFTSVAFFISTLIRQGQLSNYALNVMVSVSDRARENLAISSIVRGNSLIITIVNLGTIEVSPTYIVFIDKNLNTHKLKINGTTIPIGSIINLRIPLPVPYAELESVKLTTLRGNVFDVLVSTHKPVLMTILANKTIIELNDMFEINVFIENNLFKDLLIKPDDFTVSFINYVNGNDLTHYFVLKNTFPDEPVILRKGEKTVFRFIYQYSGGLVPNTPVSIRIDLNTLTTSYEEIYSSTYSIYSFRTA